MNVEQSVEWELAGETEVFGENLPQYHFVHHNPTWLALGSNPGRRGEKPASNRLSYGTASVKALEMHYSKPQTVTGFKMLSH
jgi:hypothetical protein